MVYGDFIACFPELQERIPIWTKDDQSDLRTIPVVYIPSEGNLIKRKKYTSGNTALDITDKDHIFVHTRYISQISTGDYFYRNGKIIWRVIGRVDYLLPADFCDFIVEKVNGTTINQQDELPIKEGYFA